MRLLLRVSAVHVLLFAGGLLLVAPGCGKESRMRFYDSFMASGVDEAPDYSDIETDQWSYVGDIARGDRAMEQQPDTFFGRNIHSSRARSIERNLGIQY